MQVDLLSQCIAQLQDTILNTYFDIEDKPYTQ